MKETIDIEDLLVWAYRNQAVEQAIAGIGRACGMVAPRSRSMSDVIVGYMQLGCRVDGSAGFVADLGAKVHVDALTLHDAVLALPTMWIWWTGADTALVATMDEITMCDCAIRRDPAFGDMLYDRFGKGRGRPVQRIEPAIEIIKHARAGGRPDAHESWRRGPGRFSGPRTGAEISQGMVYRIGEGDVMHARAIYAAWHRALGILAERCADAMEDHVVTGPRLCGAPWLKTRRVLETVDLEANSIGRNTLKSLKKKTA
jgi:hypothetical protein